MDDANFSLRRTMLQGRRILVVEDEGLVAMMIEDELPMAGAEVVGPAASVSEALQLIDVATDGGGLCAAVLDVQLAGEVVQPVADRLATLGVPFVFATGYREHSVTCGHAAPVLLKPFDMVELITILKELTGCGPGRSWFAERRSMEA